MTKTNKLKLSFDFDGTLGHNEEIMDLFVELQKTSKYDMYIITRRQDRDMSEVYAVADSLDLDHMNVYNTNLEYKHEILDKLDIDLHIDDDFKESLNSPVGNILRIFCYKVHSWKQKYMNILQALEKRAERFNYG